MGLLGGKRSRQLVGLDIGSSSIKAVELKSTKGGYELVSFGMETLAQDTVVDGAIMDAPQVANAISRIFDNEHIKTKNVATSVSGHSVIVKRVPLPLMSEEELYDRIPSEASQHIPFDIADVNLSYQLLESMDAQMDVLLVAVKKDKILNHTNVLAQAGKTPVIVDIDAFGLQNCFEINYEPDAGQTVAGSPNRCSRRSDIREGSGRHAWIIAMTGRGTPKWTVERDDTAPSKGQVLKQSGTATYPLAFKDGTNVKDGFVEVKFKALSGSEDRAGGLVWRAKDANNYYVVRANALEDNVVLYKTVNGARSSLDIVGRKGGYGVKIAVPANRWHTLRVEFVGARFNVIFNGRSLFEVEDATFNAVGVWTKADSVTAFNAFTYGEKK